MLGCFMMIYGISKYQGHTIEKAYDDAAKGKLDLNAFNKIKYISIAITWIIVFFNKFIIGQVIHHIVDLEKISTKTKFNISYGKTYSFALFLNTAIITYVVEIVGEKNFFGPGIIIVFFLINNNFFFK
jgi:uncharacterized oligopeptide transporter (OPT) family protein